MSLHYVLSERSRGTVGSEELKQMKPSAIVNPSRGPLINKDALLYTVEQGKFRGVALDVFDLEPLPETSPWRRNNLLGEEWTFYGSHYTIYGIC